MLARTRRRFIVLCCGLALAVAAYGGASVYLLVMQRELIFEPRHDVLKTPADFGLAFEDVRLTARDGSKLAGWWIPSAAADPNAPALLYLHGNEGNIGANAEHSARLARMGYSVLIVDYRGYGASGGGFPSEAHSYEDAEAAWSYLVKIRHADPRRSFIYGHSLGGAIGIDLAVNHPEAAGLIVESTFTSMREMADARYGYFPVDLLLNQRFESLEKIAKVRLPTLFIHGKADTLVPYSMSERLYAAASEPKRLVLIPGAGHENSATVGGAAYTDAVREFVASVEKTH